jgi:SAM-dependent methyltransferase
MALFNNAYQSHDHSLEILNLIYGYDSFLDSLQVIADMGCGMGLDTKWWATLMTRDDPPEPRDYVVYAVDQNLSGFDYDIKKENPNVITLERNFENRCIPSQVDLIWAHDSFQYAQDPWKCLASWKDTLNENGMLILAVPQTTYMYNNRLVINSYDNQWYSYNILNLMYMLAATGFDCKDAYFYRKLNTPWLYAAVYASDQKPQGPGVTWYELVERGLVNDSVANSVNRRGYAHLNDIIVTWLDKDYYQIFD